MQRDAAVVNYKPRVEQMTQQVLAGFLCDWQAASTAFSHWHPAASADGCESAIAGPDHKCDQRRVAPVSRRLVPVSQFLVGFDAGAFYFEPIFNSPHNHTDGQLRKVSFHFRNGGGSSTLCERMTVELCVCVCLCRPAAPHRLGPGRVLPPVSGVQRQSGVQVLQRSGAPGRLPGRSARSPAVVLVSCGSVPGETLKNRCVPDVRLQPGHVESGLHAGQYDLSEGAILPRAGQLRPGASAGYFNWKNI